MAIWNVWNLVEIADRVVRKPFYEFLLLLRLDHNKVSRSA